VWRGLRPFIIEENPIMSRALWVALIAAAVLPASVSAQYGTVPDGPIWGERLRVTPFAGVAPRVTRNESLSVLLNGTSYDFALSSDLGAGPAVGAEIEYRLYERFSIIGGGLLIARGEVFETDQSTGEFLARPGSDFLIAKLGLAVRLREAVSDLQLRNLTATAFAAPAFIREVPGTDLLLPAGAVEAMNSLGVNVGVNASIPLPWQSVAVQLGFEDFMVFWNEGALASRNDAILADAGLLTETRVQADLSHMVLFRAGVTWRIR
jgi:hypothetical protein